MPYPGSDDDETYRILFLRSDDRTPSYAPTPGYFRGDTSSLGCLSPEPEQTEDICTEQQTALLNQTQPDLAGPHQGVEQEDGGLDAQVSDYIQYVIEWRVTLNRRVVVKDTEQDLVQMPSFYWPRIQARACDILHSKIARNRQVRPDDMAIVVSVNDRSQRDLVKHFDGSDVDWNAIEKQLLSWASLYRLGKELRLKISVNYIEDSAPSALGSDKRGKSSVTKRMLVDRDAQLDAEEASGQPSVWREVYQMIRCPGPPCRHEGQYCWQEPKGKRHYKLRTHQLRSLVRYVEKGGILETHDDVPDGLREQLYAENEDRATKQKSQTTAPLGTSCPPINITVLPSQASQAVIDGTGGPAFVPPTCPTPDPINIHGLHDVAVEEYT
ncbi:hypothetical protein N7456_006849 [Penicillium angulare]|uniref:Uncharacterized protein n=1 Tax=Penicillium angulare TaxID=116970 RepID=A0A9W9FII6_9EURO|nr:hypothetical protein N7456_006849 [Penicillium angulare]